MKRIGELLDQGFERAEILRLARAQKAMRKWPEAVGTLLAAKGTPDQYEKGTLWIAAEGSAWAQEFQLRKHQILDRLNEIAGEKALFSDLRARVRPPRSLDPKT